MRRFTLYRLDQGGVVAEGIQFSSGKCAISWVQTFTSVTIFDDLATIQAIHGDLVVRWDEEHHPTIPATAVTCPVCRSSPITPECPLRCHTKE